MWHDYAGARGAETSALIEYRHFNGLFDWQVRVHVGLYQQGYVDSLVVARSWATHVWQWYGGTCKWDLNLYVELHTLYMYSVQYVRYMYMYM